MSRVIFAAVVLLGVALSGCSGTPPERPEPGPLTFGSPAAYILTEESSSRVRQALPTDWRETEKAPTSERELLDVMAKDDVGFVFKLNVKHTAEQQFVEGTTRNTIAKLGILNLILFPITLPVYIVSDGDRTVVKEHYVATVSCLSHEMKDVVVEDGWIDEPGTPATMKRYGRKLVDQVRSALADAKPFTRDRISARRNAINAAPALAALTEADENLAGGRVPQASDYVAKAETLARGIEQPDVEARIAATRSRVRAALVDYYIERAPAEAANADVENAVKHLEWLAKNTPETRRTEIAKLGLRIYENGMTAIREKLLGQDRIEDARAAGSILASLVGDNEEKLAALRSEITTRAKTLAATLADKAGAMKGFQCFEAEPLVKRALVLDPTNENATGLLTVVQKNISELTPTYVKDVHAQVEGDGYVVWFTVANAKGEMVPAPGKADVFLREVCTSSVDYNQYANSETNKVELPLHSFSETVAFDSYKEVEVGVNGIGGKRLMHICKRVPFSELKRYDQMARTMYSVGTPLYTLVKVQFTPERGEMLVGTGKTSLHR